ncbi:MAG TPA: hypothetical protein VHA56_01010 [Mucilaginibacter sp.]|nr:hypothetical protein [Mucilaginibacter sp.]
MFKQFTENIDGNQVYLLLSLSVFFIFFIVVGIVLIRIRKHHVIHMSDLPLHDGVNNLSQPSEL